MPFQIESGKLIIDSLLPLKESVRKAEKKNHFLMAVLSKFIFTIIRVKWLKQKGPLDYNFFRENRVRNLVSI